MAADSDSCRVGLCGRYMLDPDLSRHYDRILDTEGDPSYHFHFANSHGSDHSVPTQRDEQVHEHVPPPPRRDDERYGPLAGNAAGDKAFREDRRAWYEQVTSESLEALSLSEQCERAHTLARSWRSYSDGRRERRT